MKKIHEHFRKTDPVMHRLAEKIGILPLVDVSTDHFTHLVESIIGQQLSEKAGSTITNRFYEILGNNKLTPETLLELPDETIRSSGTSWSKISYMKNISRAVLDGSLHFDALQSMGDDEVIERLTQVKGIGRWTSEMFLMFSLGRPDIFSVGDAGLRRAIQKLYEPKSTDTQMLITISSKWSPYRSYASRLLWKSLQ